MRCIGFDPGSKAIVWGIVEAAEGALRYVAAGEIDVGAIASEIPRVVREYGPQGGAVEKAVGYTGQDFNPAPVVDTGWFGGQAWGMLTALGVPCHTITMRDWRGGLMGRVSAGDAMVKCAIVGLLGASLPRQTNNHVRDALGVAIFGRVKHVGGSVSYSNQTMIDMEELWRAQQQKNTSKGQNTRRGGKAAARIDRAGLGVVRRRSMV